MPRLLMLVICAATAVLTWRENNLDHKKTAAQRMPTGEASEYTSLREPPKAMFEWRRGVSNTKSRQKRHNSALLSQANITLQNNATNSSSFHNASLPVIVCPERFSCRSKCHSGVQVQRNDSNATCFCDCLCIYLKDCCADYGFYCTNNTLNTTSQNCHMNSSILRKWREMKCVSRIYNRVLYTQNGQSMCRTFETTSVSIRMVTTCPISWPKDDVYRNCTGSVDLYSVTANNYESKMSLMVPVFSDDGVVYRNRFCAVCNGQNNTTSYHHELSCHQIATVVLSPLVRNLTEDEPPMKYSEKCTIAWFRKRHPGRDCTSIIDNCLTGRPFEEVKRCNHGTPGIVTKYGTNYKNIYCAKCHGNSDAGCGPVKMVLRNKVCTFQERVPGFQNVVSSLLLETNIKRPGQLYWNDSSQIGYLDKQHSKVFIKIKMYLVANTSNSSSACSLKWLHLSLQKTFGLQSLQIWNLTAMQGKELTKVIIEFYVQPKDNENIDNDDSKSVDENSLKNILSFKGTIYNARPKVGTCFTVNKTTSKSVLCIPQIANNSDTSVNHSISYCLPYERVLYTRIALFLKTPIYEPATDLQWFKTSLQSMFDIKPSLIHGLTVTPAVNPLGIVLQFYLKHEKADNNTAVAEPHKILLQNILSYKGIFTNKTGGDIAFYTVYKTTSEAVYCFQDHNKLQYNSTDKAVQFRKSKCWRVERTATCAGSIVNLKHGEYCLLDNGLAWVNASGTIYSTVEFSISRNGIMPLCVESSKIPKNLLWDEIHDQILGWFTAIGLGLSIVALLYVLVTYSIFKELRNLPGIHIMNLSTSVLLSQILWMISDPSTVQSRVLCTAIACALHCLFLTSFAWMSVIAFSTWRTFSRFSLHGSDETGTLALLCRIAVVWLLPLAYTSICIALDQSGVISIGYGSQNLCWIAVPKSLLYFFAIPVALFLLFNISFFSMTVYSINKAVKQAQMAVNHAQRRRNFWIYVRISSLMGFTWIFGFAAYASGWPYLLYPFAVFNVLQGVYIALAFGLNQRVRAIYVARFGSKCAGRYRSTTNQSAKTTVIDETTV